METEPRGIDRLLDVVTRLRGPDGCPWDREQTLDSLKPCLLEESYELLEAVDSGDPAAHREELGDVLLQVVMQAHIRQEAGDFGFDEVAHCLTDKLIRRHPHVFGDVTVKDSREVLANWEAIKSKEKGKEEQDLLDGIPAPLPALQKAQRVQSRVARVGFDWDDVNDVLAKVEEELDEVKEAMDQNDPDAVAEELGDLLFAVVNLSRFRKVNAEDALRKTVGKFIERFRRMAGRLRAEGKNLEDCSLEEMDRQWDAVKRDGA